MPSNNELTICEEIGMDLHNFKSVLETTLDLISETVYKNQQGDYIVPTSFSEIADIYCKLKALSGAIKQMQSIIEHKIN